MRFCLSSMMHSLSMAKTEAVIEVFVARGYSKDKAALYNELSDGLLDDEMEYLRQQARPEREGAK